MIFEPFHREFPVVVHEGITINALYTNMSAYADSWFEKAEGILAESKLKVVGVDVEFSPKGFDQKADVLQLCVGQDCLVYHIACAADEISWEFKGFIRSWRYKFVGFDITSDTNMLRRSDLSIYNHIDIQKIWKDPDLMKYRKDGSIGKHGLKDLAGLLVDPLYFEMKGGMTNDDHQLWHKAPLSEKHLHYAAKDAYVTYELYRKLDFYERGRYKLIKKTQKERLRKW